MVAQRIRPVNRIVDIKGKIAYGDSQQAWSIIRLKKEILDEFPQLKERNANFTYKMVFYREYDTFEKAMRKERKNKEVPPILLMLYKEKQEFPN